MIQAYQRYQPLIVQSTFPFVKVKFINHTITSPLSHFCESSSNQNFIYKFSVGSESPKSESSCSGAFENWVDGSDYCYQKVDEPKNWFDAKTSCSDLGGTLVTIYSDSVMQAIIEHSGGENRWIGLKKDELEDGKLENCLILQRIKL